MLSQFHLSIIFITIEITSLCTFFHSDNEWNVLRQLRSVFIVVFSFGEPVKFMAEEKLSTSLPTSDEQTKKNTHSLMQAAVATYFSSDELVHIDKQQTMESYYKRYGQTRVSFPIEERNIFLDAGDTKHDSPIHTIYDQTNKDQCHTLKIFDIPNDSWS